jgi:catechol 2,3-dioxygenase-like lactoylglutathione lyase family enzyme
VATFTGVHHVGITVRNLDESLRWYGELLDARPLFVEVDEGPEVSAIVRLEDCRVRSAVLDVGGCMLELLEYERPVGTDHSLRNCDVGAMHVCFEVEDIEAVYEKLAARGVEFSAEPTLQVEGFNTGQKYCYFQDPDGIQLEICQRPAAALD